MTDRRIHQAHDDLSSILRPTTYDGRTQALYQHAYKRLVLEADDGLGAVDYSRDRISGSHGDGKPHTGRNPDLDAWNTAVRMLYQGAAQLYYLTMRHQPRRPDTVSLRAAEADNRRTDALLCAHCATIGHHSEARSATTCTMHRTDGSVAWELPYPMTLCDWCQNVAKQVHRLPNDTELRQHANARKVLLPEMDKRRAEAAMLVAGEGAGVGDVQTWSGGDVA